MSIYLMRDSVAEMSFFEQLPPGNFFPLRKKNEQSAERSLLCAVREHLAVGGKYLVAFSGGVDSSVLLHLLLALRNELSLTVEVAHVDHGFRRESGREAGLLQERCEADQIPFHLKRLPERPPGTNEEQWAREERYAFFRSLLEGRKLETVLTAHHQRDLVETFLMRLFSNKTPHCLPVYNPKLRSLRPLLSCTREEIVEYATEQQLSVLSDPSNDDLSYLRNAVRYALGFLRQTFGRGIEETLASQAKAIHQELAALEEVAAERVESLSECQFGERSWCARLRELLQAAPAPVGERMLQQLFLPLLGAPLGRRSAGQLREFFLSGETAVQLPQKVEIRRRGGGITVSIAGRAVVHRE
ncbi:tRNA lysidine(34) synthetase TilS [bacterium]|nr:tRNA lysidine(34) synthetase TilS [bacterium]